MKKILGMLLAALMVFGSMTAMAESEFYLEGVVIEVTEEYAILDTEEFGQVQVNYDAETELEGLEVIELDTYVFVTYDGKMTRSIPAQVYAQKIAMHVISGVVLEVSEGTLLIEQDEELGQIIVHLKEDMAELYVGCVVKVYHSGVMAMSYPAQVGALHLTTPTLMGEVTEVNEGNFLLTDAEGVAWQVNTSETTISDAEVAVGDSVTVYYSGAETRSLPPQISAIAIEHAVG